MALGIGGLSAALFCSIFASPAMAQSASPGVAVTATTDSPARGLVNDDWLINIGAFVVGTKFEGNLNGAASGSGQTIDFDKQFGTGADATRVRADVLWRINPRHHVRLLYFDNNVTRTRTITKDIVWGDLTFPANASVTAKNKFEVLELAYEYAFMRDRDYEVVGSFGVHTERWTLGLSGLATVTLPDGTVQSASAESKSSSVPAPLPVLGLRGGWAVSPNWYLDAQAQFFKFKIEGVDGHWWDLRAGATYMFTRHFGAGVGYNSFKTNVDLTKGDFSGHLNVGYSGFLAYLTGTF